MDEPLVSVFYKTAGGKRICVDVSVKVKKQLEFFERQTRSRQRKDRRYLNNAVSIDSLSEPYMLYRQESITDLLIKQERYEQLYEALNRLSDTQRARLLLYYAYGYTHRRIAKLHGVSQPTISRSIKHTITQLQNQFIM